MKNPNNSNPYELMDYNDSGVSSKKPLFTHTHQQPEQEDYSFRLSTGTSDSSPTDHGRPPPPSSSSFDAGNSTCSSSVWDQSPIIPSTPPAPSSSPVAKLPWLSSSHMAPSDHSYSYTGLKSVFRPRVWKNQKELSGFKSNSGLVKTIIIGKIRVRKMSNQHRLDFSLQLLEQSCGVALLFDELRRLELEIRREGKGFDHLERGIG